MNQRFLPRKNGGRGPPLQRSRTNVVVDFFRSKMGITSCFGACFKASDEPTSVKETHEAVKEDIAKTDDIVIMDAKSSGQVGRLCMC